MDWPAITAMLVAATALVGAITTAALKIIGAVKENTATVTANTVDRALKAAETAAALQPIATQVNDLHAAIGAAVAAAPAPPEPAGSAG